MKKPNKKMMEVFEDYGAFWHEKDKVLEIYPEGFQQEILLETEEEVERWYKRILSENKRKRTKKRWNTTNKTTKYLCFVTDNDNHWYKIPVELREQFYDWVENSETYTTELDHDELADVPEFDDYRCMHPINYMFEHIHVLKESK